MKTVSSNEENISKEIENQKKKKKQMEALEMKAAEGPGWSSRHRVLV